MGNNLTKLEEILVEQQRHLPKLSVTSIHLKSISSYRILNFPAIYTDQNFYSPLSPPVQHETDLKTWVLGLQAAKTRDY